MTQKQTVLNMLKAAGSFGVRSDTFIKDYMPRAAARIQELKDQGYEITSEREGKFTRYVLVGVGGSAVVEDHVEAPAYPSDSGKSAAPGSSKPEAPAAPPETLFEVPDTPSQYDPWEGQAA